MVAQKNTMKSSSRTKSHSRSIEIGTCLICDWALPAVAEARASPADDLGTAHYLVLGTLGTKRADASHWRNPPHQALANLPTSQRANGLVDPTAVQSFTKRYGMLRGWHVDEVNEQLRNRRIALNQDPNVGNQIPGIYDYSKPRFAFTSSQFAETQRLLQNAWGGGDEAAAAVKELEKQAVRGGLMYGAAGIEFRPSISAGGVELRTNNLWSFICLLFLSDYARGKPAKCANPECPAPYFLKKRITQKYCEAGECVAWAQRQSALKWWHKEHGKSNRSIQK
jgi:hypothetical protein